MRLQKKKPKEYVPKIDHKNQPLIVQFSKYVIIFYVYLNTVS